MHLGLVNMPVAVEVLEDEGEFDLFAHVIHGRHRVGHHELFELDVAIVVHIEHFEYLVAKFRRVAVRVEFRIES